MANRPVRLHPGISVRLVSNQISSSIEQNCEASGKRRMKVIACPRHVIMTIKDVRISVMPCPEQLLYADYVEWNIKQHHRQTNCEHIPKANYNYTVTQKHATKLLSIAIKI